MSGINIGDFEYRKFFNDGTNTFVRTQDIMWDISQGNVSGMKMYTIPGRKDSISATVLDDVTQVPSTTVIPSPGGIQLEVVSSSGDDVSVGDGTGVQQVDIHYLDTDGAEQTEIVIMAGATPVNTVATDIDFVQWMHSSVVGTGGVAAGNISLRNTAGTVTYEYIAAGGNQSLSARVKVPAGKTGYIMGWQG
ncbi:unnamed protein product, partial [marine sediment metagenome]